MGILILARQHLYIEMAHCHMFHLLSIILHCKTERICLNSNTELWCPPLGSETIKTAGSAGAGVKSVTHVSSLTLK